MTFIKTFSSVPPFCKYTENNFNTLSEKKHIVQN